LVRWAVEEADETVALRLVIGPSPRRIELPAERPAIGRGSVVRDGDDAVLVTYGPVMLHEALVAAEELADGRELSLRVVALPWLNRFDADWLAAEVAPFDHLFVLEDHAPVGGLGDGLRAALPGRVVTVFGVEGWPACGTPDQARLGRPPRPALDPRLLRYRNRDRAPRAPGRAPRGRLPRAARRGGGMARPGARPGGAPRRRSHHRGRPSRPCPRARRRHARPAARLPPARDPPERPARLPHRADAAGASELDARHESRQPPPASAPGRACHGAMVLQPPTPRSPAVAR